MNITRLIIALCFVFIFSDVTSQQTDPYLLDVKSRLDAISAFQADLHLELDVDFINMPPKTAQMEYVRDKPIKFSSDDFVMIPRRGLDFSFRELFRYPFITVPIDNENDGIRSLHVIPSDKRSDLVMVTLSIDKEKRRILTAEVNTQNDGTYDLVFTYASANDVLPSALLVTFQIERIRIPFNFIGQDTEIDRKRMKEDGQKTGKIYLRMSNYRIQESSE